VNAIDSACAPSRIRDVNEGSNGFWPADRSQDGAFHGLRRADPGLDDAS
jgi:hypothetical protein